METTTKTTSQIEINTEQAAFSEAFAKIGGANTVLAFDNLCERFRDEHKYEPVSSYIKALQACVPGGTVLGFNLRQATIKLTQPVGAIVGLRLKLSRRTVSVVTLFSARQGGGN
jgi:hypothetical protein